MQFLAGGGQVGSLMRARSWSDTSLGPVGSWPQSLRSVLSALLNSPILGAVLWGPDLLFLYNDAYVPSLADRHPSALGLPVAEVWGTAWKQVSPAFYRCLATGEGFESRGVELSIVRNGREETTYWNFSAAPIRGEDGSIVGLLNQGVETTTQVLQERLRAAEIARQRRLLQNMPGFVATLAGPDHVYKYVNDAYRAISGDRDFVGRTVREVFPDLEGQGFYELLDRVFATGEPVMLQAAPIRLAGQDEDRFIDLVYEPTRDTDGAIAGIFVAGYDITRRVTAERALDAAEAASVQALDATSEAFYAVDRTGLTTLCNAAFVEMLGFESKDAVIGRALHDVIHHSHPDGRHYDRDDCPIYRTAAAGIPAHVSDELFFRLDGTPFPVEYRAEPIFTGGVLSGAICTFTDITERRAAQAALAASAEEFRTFAQAMPNHVWASQPDGMLNWFNQRVYDYSGAHAHELDDGGWTAMIHPDDLPLAGKRWAAALASGQGYETEFRLRRADGIYRWHLARAIPIRDASGAMTRWIGTNTDIEDQRASAAALARLNETLEQQVAERTAERDRMWETSPDLMLVLDFEGVFRRMNPAWTTVLGYLPEELVGHHVNELVVPSDAHDMGIAQAAAAVGDVPRVETRFRHKDGSIRWISWVAAPAGGVTYATGRDVTDEKARAEELAQTQEALRQSQKMEAVGQLTGGIAHDFNNMLTVIMGSLDLLSRRIGADDPRSRRYVDVAMDGGRRAALLTQRLLAFSRQQPLQPEEIDPNELVTGMSDLLPHSLGAEIRLDIVLARGAWRTHVDPNQLENAILNLAVNGRDAMPGGGRLTIETQNVHLDATHALKHSGVPAGEYVLIAVGDTGIGMPAEVVVKAFDPFFTTKEVGKGTGLGLSQVYGFVKQSGGHVKIYSEPGAGTTVKVYLPRLMAEPGYVPASRGSEAPPPADGQKVVLVVDDEAAVRRFSVDALTELGYRVLEAESGEMALRLLDAHPETVLMFTDVVMPEMNGRKLADEARRRHPGLRILFTTGYTPDALVHDGASRGDVAPIGKPFTMDALAARLGEILGAPVAVSRAGRSHTPSC